MRSFQGKGNCKAWKTIHRMTMACMLVITLLGDINLSVRAGIFDLESVPCTPYARTMTKKRTVNAESLLYI